MDISKNHLSVKGRNYRLPNGWKDREEAYKNVVKVLR